MFQDDRLYRTDDEELLVLGTPGSMAIKRHKGQGPPFIKAGQRVLYSGRDLNDWLNERRVTPTS